ncbi:phosphate ABC transporter permease PstA [Streptomyces bohaiensis]|uniref:Phosphate transport system permease protein PstA n=1 Tax=Streptomyces bohaiensis TaxID=1431344 RepID=A0ABX1CDC7_9ACTN|nr:phosphate ABC transporter permease PstA [Streptomyces bohaiensis]NJQ17091.1 phosphate ABC transporter permease PstA [Streptomyces bohaiensis]
MSATSDLKPAERGAGERTTPTGHRPLRETQGNAARRAVANRVALTVLTVAMVVAVIPLVLILFKVASEGLAAVGWNFFTLDEPTYRVEEAGYRAGFVGTAYIMVGAILMAIPLGLATAIYLVEYGRGRLASFVRFFTDVMTGIPSIFVGLFVYGLLISSGAIFHTGFSAFAASLAIAIIMLPIVTRSSEEMLKLVPDEWRNASYALGASKSRTVLTTVLPAAAPGLATGSMLAVARGVGETAPLILTALGSRYLVTTYFSDAQGAVPLQIHSGAMQPFEAGVERAWGGALSLFVIVLLLVVAARFVGSRANKLG